MIECAAVSAKEICSAVRHIKLIVSDVNTALHVTQEPNKFRRGKKGDVMFVMTQFRLLPAFGMLQVNKVPVVYLFQSILVAKKNGFDDVHRTETGVTQSI